MMTGTVRNDPMAKPAPDVKNLLMQMPLFAQLKGDVLEGFVRYAQYRHEPKGTMLIRPDSVNDKFFIVVSGYIKIFRETLAGDEAITDILSTGHTFGEVGLSGTESVPYGAEVVEDAAVIALPRFLVAEEVIRNGIFGMQMLQHMTRQRMKRDMELEHRTVQTAPQRIGCFLLKFCKGQEQEVHLHLPYDKNTIAFSLGMQPETFSRALARLRSDTGIQISGASIYIPDLKKLVAYTCSACSSNFPCVEHG